MLQILKRIFNLRGDLGSLFGGGSSGNANANLKTPTFQADTSYQNASKSLADLGTGILNGNLPSFYSNIGKQNSPAFQATVANTTGQINNASAQAAAAAGTDRSGVAQTAAAGALANVLPQMNYQDFLNSQQQQIGLLNTGIGVEQNVGAMGLTNQSQINNFAQSNFTDQLNLNNANNTWNANAAAQQGAATGSLLSAGLDIGLAPFTGGASLMGLPGALGSAGGNGSSRSSGMSSLLSGIGGMFKSSPSTLASNGVPSVNQWANFYGA